MNVLGSFVTTLDRMQIDTILTSHRGVWKTLRSDLTVARIILSSATVRRELLPVVEMGKRANDRAIRNHRTRRADR